MLLITVSTIIVPSAVAILHRPPRGVSGKTKVDALTLRQLQEAAGSGALQIVSPTFLLEFDSRKDVSSSDDVSKSFVSPSKYLFLMQ